LELVSKKWYPHLYYAKADSLSCHIVARKYVFTRFKTLKDRSVVAVEGGIVR
jgi:hypothetical protein